MKKTIKLFVTIICASVISVSAFAYDCQVDGIYYNLNDDSFSATVTYKDHVYNSDAYSGDVVIPSTISYNGKTYQVNVINVDAFANCRDLTSIVIGDNVWLIRSSAFYECTGLTSVTFGSATAYIEPTAFYHCTSLTSIICKSENPPFLDNDFWDGDDQITVFEGLNTNNVILQVPCGASSNYQNDNGWSTFTNIIEDCESSNISNIEKEFSVFVYPNPAKENITLQANEDIFIFNNIGQIVKQVNNPKGETTISIFDLPKGIYYIKVGEKKQKLIKE